MSTSVCVVGDSISAGVIYQPETGRYGHFEDSYINLLAKELGLELKNHAKFGLTFPAALKRLERFSADIAACDRTIVMLGGNDSDFDWPAVADAPEEPHDCNTPPQLFEESCIALLKTVSAMGGTPIAVNMAPVYGRRYFKWFSQKSDPDALLRFLGTTDSIEHWNEMYSLAVARIASKLKVPLMDVRSAFLCRRDWDDLYCPDGIHPSPEGHCIMARHLLPQLEALI